MLKKVIWFLYPKVDKVIPITREEADNLSKNYWISWKKIINIYNMFDLNHLMIKSKECLWSYGKIFDNWKFTFINIWRLSKQKNQEILLNAFDKLHKKYSNIQLLILWDWELSKKLQTHKETLLSNNDIHFLWVHSNPYMLLKNSNAFVSTSSWEGMPRSILEALACELPIISTNCPTWPKEILEDNPDFHRTLNRVEEVDYWILIPIKDQKNLLIAMEKIYTSPKIYDYYMKKSKLRAKYFDINNIIDKWISIL